MRSFFALALVTLLSEASYAAEGIELKNKPYRDPRPSAAFFNKVTELSNWVDAHSKFGKVKIMPAFIFLTREELEYIYYQSFKGYFGASSHDPTQEVKGIYQPGIIFLQEDFDIAADAHVIVHELVHHRQWEKEMTFRCFQAREWEAYLLEEKYMEEQGVPPTERPNLLWAYHRSRCPDEQFPNY